MKPTIGRRRRRPPRIHTIRCFSPAVADIVFVQVAHVDAVIREGLDERPEKPGVWAGVRNA
jgi:hypothetical protein